MERIETVFLGVAVGFEMIGAVAMVVGAVIAVVLGIRSLQRGEGGATAFLTLRRTLGGGILLGLEVLVAADLIRTITSKPSISIWIVIDSVLPWRRALLTSGAAVVAGEIARGRAVAPPPDARDPR